MTTTPQTKPATQTAVEPSIVKPAPVPHRGLAALVIGATAAAGIGLTALVIGVTSGSEPEAPPSPGVAPAAETPAQAHGSDQWLYNLAAELKAERQAQRESAYGSDRRLYQRAAELEAERQALRGTLDGSDRRLYNLAEER